MSSRRFTAGMTCSVEGCDRAAHCRSWCRAHYERWRSYGDPLGDGRPVAGKGDGLRLARRIAEELAGSDACYVEWPHSVNQEGRPIVRRNGRATPVARVVAELVYGPPPTPEHVAAHLPIVCHDPRCLAPRHLRWATQGENERDKLRDRTAGTRAYRATVEPWERSA